jgi:hypothetical protein
LRLKSSSRFLATSVSCGSVLFSQASSLTERCYSLHPSKNPFSFRFSAFPLSALLPSEKSPAPCGTDDPCYKPRCGVARSIFRRSDQAAFASTAGWVPLRVRPLFRSLFRTYPRARYSALSRLLNKPSLTGTIQLPNSEHSRSN